MAPAGPRSPRLLFACHRTLINPVTVMVQALASECPPVQWSYSFWTSLGTSATLAHCYTVGTVRLSRVTSVPYIQAVCVGRWGYDPQPRGCGI